MRHVGVNVLRLALAAALIKAVVLTMVAAGDDPDEQLLGPDRGGAM